MLSNNLAGKFITFEGVEGVGKSTIIQLISSYLQSQGVELLLTREPGGTKFGEELRNILLTPIDEHISGETELLTIFAARNHHLEQVILPNIKLNKCVLCDRFTDSTYAYQGSGRGVSIASIALLENLVQKGFTPDCILILDAPHGVGLERVKNRTRKGNLDRIEQRQASFFANVRNGFLQRAQQSPNKYVVIDAQQPIHVVQQAIIAALNKKFG